eukprot:gene7669-826_t
MEDRIRRLLMKVDIAEAANEAAKSTWQQLHAQEAEIQAVEAAMAQEEMRAVHAEQLAAVTHQLEAAQRSLHVQVSESAAQAGMAQGRLQEEELVRRAAEERAVELEHELAEAKQEAEVRVAELESKLADKMHSKLEGEVRVAELESELADKMQEAERRIAELVIAIADMELERDDQETEKLRTDYAESQLLADCIQKKLQDESQAHSALRCAHEETSAVAAKAEGQVAELQVQLEGTEARLGEVSAQLESTLSSLEKEQESLRASEVLIEDVRAQNSEQLQALAAKLESSHASELAELRVQSSEELQALATKLESSHASELAELRVQSSGQLQALTAKLEASHASELAEMRVQSSEELQALATKLKASHASELEELKVQGSEELQALATNLEASHASELAEVREDAQKGAELHAAAVGELREGASKEAKAHAAALENIREESRKAAASHAAAFEELREGARKETESQRSCIIELEVQVSKLTEAHAADLEDVREESRKAAALHAAAFMELREGARKEAESQQSCISELEVQVSKLKADVDGLKEERTLLEEENAVEVRLVEELQQQVSELTSKSKATIAMADKVAELTSKSEATIAMADKLKASLELERLARSKADASCSTHQATVTGLRHAMADVEASSHCLSQQQSERIRELQMELIRSQEMAAAYKYESDMKVCSMAASIEAAHKAQAQMKVVMGEERAASDKALATSNQMVQDMQQEMQNISGSKGDLETQVKSFLVTSTRQNQAFHEIRRLINWATSPASSHRSSLAGSMDVTPKAIADSSHLDRATPNSFSRATPSGFSAATPTSFSGVNGNSFSGAPNPMASPFNTFQLSHNNATAAAETNISCAFPGPNDDLGLPKLYPASSSGLPGPNDDGLPMDLPKLYPAGSSGHSCPTLLPKPSPRPINTGHSDASSPKFSPRCSPRAKGRAPLNAGRKGVLAASMDTGGNGLGSLQGLLSPATRRSLKSGELIAATALMKSGLGVDNSDDLAQPPMGVDDLENTIGDAHRGRDQSSCGVV